MKANSLLNLLIGVNFAMAALIVFGDQGLRNAILLSVACAIVLELRHFLNLNDESQSECKATSSEKKIFIFGEFVKSQFESLKEMVSKTGELKDPRRKLLVLSLPAIVLFYFAVVHRNKWPVHWGPTVICMLILFEITMVKKRSNWLEIILLTSVTSFGSLIIHPQGQLVLASLAILTFNTLYSLEEINRSPSLLSDTCFVRAMKQTSKAFVLLTISFLIYDKLLPKEIALPNMNIARSVKKHHAIQDWSSKAKSKLKNMVVNQLVNQPQARRRTTLGRQMTPAQVSTGSKAFNNLPGIKRPQPPRFSDKEISELAKGLNMTRTNTRSLKKLVKEIQNEDSRSKTGMSQRQVGRYESWQKYLERKLAQKQGAQEGVKKRAENLLKQLEQRQKQMGAEKSLAQNESQEGSAPHEGVSTRGGVVAQDRAAAQGGTAAQGGAAAQGGTAAQGGAPALGNKAVDGVAASRDVAQVVPSSRQERNYSNEDKQLEYVKQKQKAERSFDKWFDRFISLAKVAFLLFAIYLIFLYGRKPDENKIKKLSVDKKTMRRIKHQFDHLAEVARSRHEIIIRSYNLLLELLAESKMGKEVGESPTEYANHLGNQILWLKKPLSGVTNTFCDNYYGKHKISDEVFKTFVKDSQEIMSKMRAS